MGWFSGGDKDKKGNGGGQPASNGKIRLATNAPRHWPPVVVDAWVDHPAINYLTLAGVLNRGVQSIGGSLAFHQEKLYDDGILLIPLMVVEGEQRTALFAYPRADAAAASHFSGVRSLLRQREGINAVYFAPESIQPAAPAKVVKGIDTPNFDRVDQPRPPADYALWWPTPEDPSFASSAALKHLDRWFEALDGFEMYVFSAFIGSLKIAEEPAGSQPHLYELPEEPLRVPVDAPAGLRAYLHASRAKGLWIALDLTTPAAHRDTLLKLLADFATRLRATAAEHRIAARDQGRVHAWWRMVRAGTLQREAAGAVDLRVCMIGDRASTPRQEADPSTAGERGGTTAANPLPDEALVEFAGVLMDRATSMAGQALGAVPEETLPAPGQPAPPSIPPMLSMGTGQDTWTVFFWDDETPEAIAAARDLIAEHGPVDRAAFICDTMVTVGGAKTDALFVRVQDRADDRSHAFVQRYVPRRQGQSFGLSGRWALLGREEPIYPSVAEPSTNGHANGAAMARPGERAIARAHSSIADMIKWVTFDDSSTTTSLQRKHDEGRPMLSPRLLLEGATQPGTMVMFGLMGEAAGRRAATRAAQDDKDARLAAFRYDHVRLKNGHPHRELRVVVHERGTPHAFLFAQGYQMPGNESTFRASGEIRLIGPVAPLFAD